MITNVLLLYTPNPNSFESQWMKWREMNRPRKHSLSDRLFHVFGFSCFVILKLFICLVASKPDKQEVSSAVSDTFPLMKWVFCTQRIVMEKTASLKTSIKFREHFLSNRVSGFCLYSSQWAAQWCRSLEKRFIEMEFVWKEGLGGNKKLVTWVSENVWTEYSQRNVQRTMA